MEDVGIRVEGSGRCFENHPSTRIQPTLEVLQLEVRGRALQEEVRLGAVGGNGLVIRLRMGVGEWEKQGGGGRGRVAELGW